MKREIWQYIALGIILIIAAAFRWYGQAWDSGYLFHPDERKIVLVAADLHLPSNVLQFFSSDSPLNPKFFAYGSFPIYLLRGLSALAPVGHYDVPGRADTFVALGLLGRSLSALFDLGTLVLLFLLGRRLYGPTVGLIASACLAVTVLDIQLAHFYAVDTLLTLLVVAVIYFSLRYAASGRRLDGGILAVLFGLALATKVTALPLVIPIALAMAKQHPHKDVDTEEKTPVRFRFLTPLWSLLTEVRSARRTLAAILGITLAVFLITQPYVVLDPIRYFGQVGTELLLARGWLDFPYTRQYAGTLPLVYPVEQSAVWGMGLPLGLFAWVGSALFVWQWWRRRDWNSGLLLCWAAIYFITAAGQYTKYLRYLLPLLPFLFLMAAAAFKSWVSTFRFEALRFSSYAAGGLVLLASLLYALAFSSIYARPHPWLQISQWIYSNVPAGATIATEAWDDSLPDPIRVGGKEFDPSQYQIKQLPMYDTDDTSKVQTVVDTLVASDYVVLASQRLYATIPRLPRRYPVSSRYYELLFSGQLGFMPVALEQNDPSLGPILIHADTFRDAHLPVPDLLTNALAGRWVWDWGKADESFTVYDHPMPIVFVKIRTLSADELRALLTGNTLLTGN